MKKNNFFLDLLDELHPEELTTGMIIKAFRKSFQITLKEMEEATGILESNLSKIENDKKDIGLKVALKIAAFLGVRPEIILFPEGKKEDSNILEIKEKGKKIRNKKKNILQNDLL